MLKFLLLVLAPLGCARPLRYTSTMTIVPAVEEERAGCVLDDGVYWYVGGDGMIGLGVNCEGAFQDWRRTGHTVTRWEL